MTLTSKGGTNLQAAIDNYNVNAKHFPIIKSEKLRVGQVRLLSNKDDLDAPRKIVVIASLEEELETRTCEVFLTRDMTDFSTERDFCHSPNFETSSLNFALQADFVGNVDSWQLEDPILGELCPKCISYLYVQSSKPDPDSYSLPELHTCFRQGNYQFRILDRVWAARQSDYVNFLADCNYFIDREEFMADRRHKFFDEIVITAKEKNRAVSYEFASRIKTEEQLSEFQTSSTNDYKKMLLLR